MASVFLEPCAGASCDDEDDPTPPPPPPDTYIHITEEGCELTVNFQGWGQLPDGSASGIFLIEPAPETRASGGRIGGSSICSGADGVLVEVTAVVRTAIETAEFFFYLA